MGATQLSADVIPGINSKGGGMLLPEGKTKMFYKYINFDRNSMFNGSSKVPNREQLDATANINLLMLAYGVSSNFNIGLVVPHKSIEATAKLGMNDVAIDNSGIGDILIMGRYKLTDLKKDGYQTALKFGVKLPTGSTNDGFKKAPPFARNVNTPLPTQMGTGAAEYKLGIGVSKLFENARLDANAMFTYRPLAEHDYDFGNEFAYDIGYMHALGEKFNVGVEYNGKYNSKTDMGDDANPMLRQRLPFKAFSGTVGYLTPQVQFLPFGKPKVHLEIGMAFLLHKNVKEYQPLEKKRFIVRFGYLF
ncbi:MAG: transporter [Epsilonproteobacteria bacterium]|nr:transporter [Campylobacterota bacterium]